MPAYPFVFTGILAGVWPCGTTAMIGELFGAESLSQVYAFLHTFMYENQDHLSQLSKYSMHKCIFVHEAKYMLCRHYMLR